MFETYWNAAKHQKWKTIFKKQRADYRAIVYSVVHKLAILHNSLLKNNNVLNLENQTKISGA